MEINVRTINGRTGMKQRKRNKHSIKGSRKGRHSREGGNPEGGSLLGA